MKTAVYAGSFDPWTYGHESVLLQAAPLFDEITILICNNSQKERHYPIDQMTNAIKQSIGMLDIKNCNIDVTDGLLVQYCKQHNITYLVRGIRDNMDYMYENQIANLNECLDPDLHTVYFRGNDIISSSHVRELYKYKVDVSPYVPLPVLKIMEENK